MACSSSKPLWCPLLGELARYKQRRLRGAGRPLAGRPQAALACRRPPPHSWRRPRRSSRPTTTPLPWQQRRGPQGSRALHLRRVIGPLLLRPPPLLWRPPLRPPPLRPRPGPRPCAPTTARLLWSRPPPPRRRPRMRAPTGRSCASGTSATCTGTSCACTWGRATRPSRSLSPWGGRVREEACTCLPCEPGRASLRAAPLASQAPAAAARNSPTRQTACRSAPSRAPC